MILLQVSCHCVPLLLRYSAAYAATLKRPAETEGGADPKKAKLDAPNKPVKTKAVAKSEANPAEPDAARPKKQTKAKAKATGELTDKLKQMLDRANAGPGSGSGGAA